MKPKPKTLLTVYFAGFLSNGSACRRRRLDYGLRKFEEMLGRAPCVRDLTDDADQRLRDWLIERHCRRSTAVVVCSTLRQLWRHAADRGDVPGRPRNKPARPLRIVDRPNGGAP